MNKTVLIVEDQEDNRRIMRDLLNSSGAEVHGETIVARIMRTNQHLMVNGAVDSTDGVKRVDVGKLIRRVRAGTGYVHGEMDKNIWNRVDAWRVLVVSPCTAAWGLIMMLKQA